MLFPKNNVSGEFVLQAEDAVNANPARKKVRRPAGRAHPVSYTLFIYNYYALRGESYVFGMISLVYSFFCLKFACLMLCNIDCTVICWANTGYLAGF